MLNSQKPEEEVNLLKLAQGLSGTERKKGKKKSFMSRRRWKVRIFETLTVLLEQERASTGQGETNMSVP